MIHVPLLKSLTYASYASTVDATDLLYIGCYAYCRCYYTEHQLSCLEVASMISHLIFLCMLSTSVFTMSYVLCYSHAHIQWLKLVLL